MATKNNARLTDPSTLIQAGINPKNGLPAKFGASEPCLLKENTKRFLRLIDEQDAINRYHWYNLPTTISGQDLERFLYYKGQLAFFYNETTDEFYFMPYALEGGLDFYGRYKSIHPVPMNSGADGKDSLSKYLSTIKLNVVYQPMMWEPDDNDLRNSAVLLHDYSKQLSETIIPRSAINDPIVDAMAECVPLMRTSLILSSGINGVRVSDADQYASVQEGAKGMEQAALTGKPWIPITAPIEVQELAPAATQTPSEFMVAMQSLDNLRLSGYGIENGGVFQKASHMLQDEQDMATSAVGLVYQDGLSIRQRFCHIINSIWNLGVWCEASETQIGDIDGNGMVADQQSPTDGSSPTAGGNDTNE